MPAVGQLCAQDIYNNYMSNKKEKGGSYTEKRWNANRKSQSWQNSANSRQGRNRTEESNPNNHDGKESRGAAAADYPVAGPTKMLPGGWSWADEEIAGGDERRGKERAGAGGSFCDNALRRMTLGQRLRGGGGRQGSAADH